MSRAPGKAARAPASFDAKLNAGVLLHQQGRLAEAETVYRAVLSKSPRHFNALQLVGTVCAQLQRYEEAIELLRRAITIDASLASVHHNLGNALQSAGRSDEALTSYDQALALKPHYPEAWCGKGNAYKAQERWADALACYDQALAQQPSPGDYLSRGNMLRRLGRHEEALAALDAALALQPKAVNALYNRGNSLLDLERYPEAIAAFDAVLEVEPDHTQALNNRGNALLALKRYDEALACYDEALALRPGYPNAWTNKGNTYHAMRRWDAALQCYDEALKGEQQYAEAYNGRGVVLMPLKRQTEAFASFEQAIALKPDYVEAMHNLGDALMLAKRFPEAAAIYERAWTLDAANKYVQGAAYDCRQHGCDWSRQPVAKAEILAAVEEGKPACSPFVFLSLSDDPQSQLVCARTFAQDRHPPALEPLGQGERYSHDRIRVAYLSADFHSHATAFLMAELFELHDRSGFEWFAYSFGPEREGEMRKRLEKAFDHFADVTDRSDLEIAHMLREQEIDIAVDLKGFTLHCRPGIFAFRPTPVQVNYIGYPGTMGVPYMDYIIADPTVIPKEHDCFYTEKVVRLPDTYQVNDRHRKIAATKLTRKQAGLPDAGFVFCCFNNNYKITPDVFASWMRLLLAVPGSVLWLLADNEQVVVNLRREATERGVEPQRLVFAPRMELSQHLARHRLADLFLDTSPYNAHTTTSDALWAGLPVLTWLGTTFASRVAASLLNAVGLPELIAQSPAAYEAKAVHFATHPEELNALRARLKTSRLAAPLFDTQRFRVHIEAAYRQMHERAQQGLPPEAIDVAGSASADAVFQQGTALLRQGKLVAALTLLDQAAQLDPAHAATHSNRAAALLHLGRFEDALAASQRAVELQPTFPDAWNNFGSALMKLRRLHQALEAYDKAIALKPGWADGHNNRGLVLDALGRFGAAAQAYAAVRQIDPNYRGIHSSQVFACRKSCIWPREGDPEDPVAAMERDFLQLARDGKLVAPFVLLAISDDPALQLTAARQYGAIKYPPAGGVKWTHERYSHKKIRVAYLSADFHSHATAYLMAELFEMHDRSRFEWWGISFGPGKSGPMRERLEQAFDHFVDVSNQSDEEVAQLIRSQEIEIAVDLKGYTQDCRPGILGHRPAPIQVNYLGFPGTMGAEHIDYVLGDATVIPLEDEQFYTEKVVRLPDCYQANDRQREIAAATPSRVALGLPQQGFVFCCFNNPYKITPQTFSTWMTLLNEVDGSVLWLLEGTEEAAGNLRQEAQARGVDPQRLVFAPRAPLPEHLARHRCADLFLDTLPYNAHTTTSDALWAGLPVLTCLGRTFPGRVAASLLKALGVPELVTTDMDAYVAKALELARTPAALEAVRATIARNRLTHPLFDTDRFRQHLEAAYRKMYLRHRGGQAPVAFSVGRPYAIRRIARG